MHNKDNKQSLFQKINGISRFLLIIAFIAPFFLWAFKLVYNRDISTYDSNWLSFFGSYLGGLLGGLATLIAVVFTIQSNKEEQDRKEKAEKDNKTQKSALIVYYDFQFAMENICIFLFRFWRERRVVLYSLSDDTDFEIFKKCRYVLNQFYIDSKWIHTVADLNDKSLFNDKKIEKIYEIYGHLMNISKCLDVPNNDTEIFKRAFSSMNELVSVEINISKGFHPEFRVKNDIENLKQELKGIAYNHNRQL